MKKLQRKGDNRSCLRSYCNLDSELEGTENTNENIKGRDRKT